jgi:phosphatidylglycerophosphatase A
MLIFRKFLLAMATGFGAGRFSKAPGTIGTLVALPLAALLMKWGVMPHMIFVVLLTPFAIASAELYDQQSESHDRPEVVIDEILGILIALTWLPLTWQTFLAAFVLFRILDIWKPLFIGTLDRKLKGGVGIVADDLAAGIVTNIALQYIYNSTSWLGSQL